LKTRINGLYLNLFKDMPIEGDMYTQGYWKNKFYYHIIFIILTFGIPVIGFGAFTFYINGFIVQALTELVLFAMLILIAMQKNYSITFKKISTVILTYYISLVVLIYAGPEGGGLLSVLFTIMLAGCLLEKRQILQFIFINLSIFLLLTLLLAEGFFIGTGFQNYEDTWIINLVTTQALGIGLLMLVNSIFFGFEEQAISLRASKEKYKLITENTFDVISVYNYSRAGFTYVSPSVVHLTGFSSEKAINFSMEECLTKDSLQMVQNTMAERIREFKLNPEGNNYFVFEVQEKCKKGGTVWVEISARFRYNIQNDIEIVCVSRNIEDRKKTQENLEYLNYYDQLTGVYNRHFYQEELKRLDVEKNYPLALLMLDVNGLKVTNEVFGHRAGDLLLQNLGAMLRKECSSDEVIARIGGDEFIILATGTDEKKVKALMEGLNRAIEVEKASNVMLSISMGVCVKENGEIAIEEIFKMAENDMFRHKISSSVSLRSKTIDLVMNSLYAKSMREMLHSKRIGDLCQEMGTKLGMPKEDVKQLRVAGMMHDIGKIGVADKILNKDGKLDDDEWEEMKKHPEIGYRILSSLNEFSEIAEFVLEHQERWDGQGYPRGLAGEDISLQARIIALADAYDAMTVDRSYRKGMTHEEAIDEIREGSGAQFDSNLTRVFIEIVKPG